MDINKYASEQIKTLRNRHNMTQEELAEALNVTQQTVAKYENNQRQLKQDMLFKLAHIFNVPVSRFFPSTENSKEELKECSEPSKKIGKTNDCFSTDYAVLFSKYKDLTDDDKELIKNIIEVRKKQIDVELNGK